MNIVPTSVPGTPDTHPSGSIPRVWLEQLWWHGDHHHGPAIHCDNANCRTAGQLIARAVETSAA